MTLFRSQHERRTCTKQRAAPGLLSLDDRVSFFFSSCVWADEEYGLVGLLVGLAVYAGVILDVPLPLVVFKKVLGKQLALKVRMFLSSPIPSPNLSPTLARLAALHAMYPAAHLGCHTWLWPAFSCFYFCPCFSISRAFCFCLKMSRSLLSVQQETSGAPRCHGDAIPSLLGSPRAHARSIIYDTVDGVPGTNSRPFARDRHMSRPRRLNGVGTKDGGYHSTTAVSRSTPQAAALCCWTPCLLFVALVPPPGLRTSETSTRICCRAFSTSWTTTAGMRRTSFAEILGWVLPWKSAPACCLSTPPPVFCIFACYTSSTGTRR